MAVKNLWTDYWWNVWEFSFIEEFESFELWIIIQHTRRSKLCKRLKSDRCMLRFKQERFKKREFRRAMKFINLNSGWISIRSNIWLSCEWLSYILEERYYFYLKQFQFTLIVKKNCFFWTCLFSDPNVFVYCTERYSGKVKHS